METTQQEKRKLTEFLPAEIKDYPIRNARYISIEKQALSFLTGQRLIHPNHITCFRFAVAGILLCLSPSLSYLHILILLALGGLSDFVDGAFARAASRKTRLGMILDPLADKVLVFVILYVLLARKAIDPVIVLLMFAMEGHLILVPVLSLVQRRAHSRDVPWACGRGVQWISLPLGSQAARSGKIKFMLYALGLMAILLGNLWGSDFTQRVGNWLLIFGIMAGAVAFVQYMIRWWKKSSTGP